MFVSYKENITVNAVLYPWQYDFMNLNLQLSGPSGFCIEMEIILRLLSSLQEPYSNESSSSATGKGAGDCTFYNANVHT